MLEHKTEDDVTGLLGSVGNDMYGELYQQLLMKEDISPFFETFEKIITGLCLVFCKDRDRGHLTDLGASILISKEFVQRMWKEFHHAKLIYTELFILKHKREIVYMLAELGLEDGRCFGFNLPSFFFLENYFEDIRNLIEYADVIFANAAEAKFFGGLLNVPVIDFYIL